MTTLKPFDNLLAIETEASNKEFYISGLNYLCCYNGYRHREVIQDLGLHDYKLLGCVTQTEIDFDVESIVDWIESNACGRETKWIDYTNPDGWFETEEESFRSLLSYNGIEIKEGYKLVILEKE